MFIDTPVLERISPIMESSQRAWATIDLAALRHNLNRVRELCPEAGIIAVVKADAYGHGMAECAAALRDAEAGIRGFAVATLEEARRLRQLQPDLPIQCLNGFRDRGGLQDCARLDFEPVLHEERQLRLLREFQMESNRRLTIWLKHNSGMNRLGMPAETCLAAGRQFGKRKDLEVRLMSHLAWADDLEDPGSAAFTQEQLLAFENLYRELASELGAPPPSSMSASSGILCLPDAHYDFVRPGIMLYGSSPLAGRSAADLDLLPVMTLRARLLAVREVKAGEAVGYGAAWRFPRDTRMGVISIGYADGYPRSAVNGTPVLVASGGGFARCKLVGRVSMDMITVDLGELDGVEPGSEVILWGAGLDADEVASRAGTIAYELFTRVTARAPKQYN